MRIKNTYLFALFFCTFFFTKIPTSQLYMYCFVPPSSINRFLLQQSFFKELVSRHPYSSYSSSLYLFEVCTPACLSLLVSYLNSLIYFFDFVFVFLYLFMCCALFLIVHPILGNNVQVLGELPRKSKTMTRTWCILFLVLSPSCYSPSVCLHIFFVSVGSIIDGASHPRSSAPYWVCLDLVLNLLTNPFFSEFF